MLSNITKQRECQNFVFKNDGLESISLDMNVYKLMKIEEISNSDITSDEKIIEIKTILKIYNIKDAIIEYKDAMKMFN